MQETKNGRIRTRESNREIKVIDKPSQIGRNIRKTYIRTRDQAQPQSNDRFEKPEDYAEEKVRNAERKSVQEAKQFSQKAGKKIKGKIEDRLDRKRKEKLDEKRNVRNNANRTRITESVRQDQSKLRGL